jgi:hypothetical protein
MARNEIFICAAPEDVFWVLSNPHSYGDWVVGSREIRAADHDWPAAGRVRLQLRSEGSGTWVTMVEEPSNRLLSMMIGPVGHWLMKLRNVEALRRLKQLAEGYAPPPAGERPDRAHADDG